MRARIVQLIREFFIKEGFLEVETPVMVPCAGQEPYLNPLRTKVWDERNRAHDAYLITSPEYAHKKLLAAGFEKTFELTRAFRAGERWGGLHNPEFAILEWYRAQADYTKIMDDVETMVRFVAETTLQHLNIKYGSRTVDLSSPWERLTVREAFARYASVDLDTIQDDTTFFKVFLTKIEPKLGFPKPTILYDYPPYQAGLARLIPPFAKGGMGGYAERFEVYIAGIELANAFSELTDSDEQRKRFLEEEALRQKLGKERIPLDEDFLDAVSHMPPCAGIAFGIDRLVMLLTGAQSIEEAMAFPAPQLFSS